MKYTYVSDKNTQLNSPVLYPQAGFIKGTFRGG
jgi:hypothetical protein